jgi:hypothetical protein
MHQSRLHYQSLVQAVRDHRPNVVAIVGDALEAFSRSGRRRLSVEDCAETLGALPVEHIVFVRGNHEDTNWSQFVSAWPHERRRLVGLYGTAYSAGPLVITGFPCMTGLEDTWCEHLSACNDSMSIYEASHRLPLPVDNERWLADLIRRTGPPGRTFWLMHEGPVGLPLSDVGCLNPAWTNAVERYCPRLVAFGHDHYTPLENGRWYARLEDTTCVNVGQDEESFHYAVLDFDFPGLEPSLPTRIRIKAFPWNQEILL